MAKRVVRGTITVLREDPKNKDKKKRVVPTIGEAFDFTAEEIKSIDATTPGALEKLTAKDDDGEGDTQTAAEKKAAKEAAAKEAADKKAADEKAAKDAADKKADKTGDDDL